MVNLFLLSWQSGHLRRTLNLPKETSKLGMAAMCGGTDNYVLHRVYCSVYRLSPYYISYRSQKGSLFIAHKI